MSHLKTAYDLGAQKAREQFEKHALGRMLAMPAIGAGGGALTGALFSDPGERGEGALRGAGLGALLGTAGGIGTGMLHRGAVRGAGEGGLRALQAEAEAAAKHMGRGWTGPEGRAAIERYRAAQRALSDLGEQVRHVARQAEGQGQLAGGFSGRKRD